MNLNKKTYKTALYIISICFFCINFAFGSQISDDKYIIDQKKSSILFSIKNFGLITVNGNFNTFSGTIHISNQFEISQIEANADISSIDTGITSRDKHLRGEDFFDQDNFPKMLFKSTSITGSRNSFQLIGNLTIKGTTKSVVFNVKEKQEEQPKKELHFTAETSISRTDFHITHGSTISDEVTIQLDIVAIPST